MPEAIRERMRTRHLNILFGLAPEPPQALPFCGQIYNKVKGFPAIPASVQRRPVV